MLAQVLRDSEDIAEHPNLEFVETLVHRALEQGLELVHAILNFVFRGFGGVGGLEA